MAKPVPSPSSVSAPYWEATAAGELRLQRCRACRSWVHYPRGACPQCFSQDLGFERVAGAGKVYSFTTVNTGTGFPSYADRVPYTIVLVELDEGPRMIANLLDVAPEDVRIGMPVALTFEERGAITLPQFRAA